MTNFNGLLGSLTTNQTKKAAAWNKASVIPGLDPAWVRADAYGHRIAWLDYGDRNSEFGWEIDHIVGIALGGSDDLSNLRALHWRQNAGLGGLLSAILKR